MDQAPAHGAFIKSWGVSMEDIERFASLVAAAERERAAKVCEVDWDSETKSMGKYFAAAIRALP